jgi:CRP-like cAMP-binding protein
MLRNYGREKLQEENLLKSALFRGFSGSEVKQILDLIPCRIETYKRENVMALQGYKMTEIGIVLEGLAKASTIEEDGEESTDMRYWPFEVLGLFISSEHCQESPFQFSAERNSMVLWLEMNWEDVFHNTFGLPPSLHETLIRNSIFIRSDITLYLEFRVCSMIQRLVKKKILCFFSIMAAQNKSNTFTLTMSQPQLAEFLGTTVFTLNAELSKLRKAGEIEYHKKTYTLLK